MPLPTKENPKIKYVKKASQWCTTYFTFDDKGNAKMVQEWTQEEPKYATNHRLR